MQSPNRKCPLAQKPCKILSRIYQQCSQPILFTGTLFKRNLRWRPEIDSTPNIAVGFRPRPTVLPFIYIMADKDRGLTIEYGGREPKVAGFYHFMHSETNLPIRITMSVNSLK